MHPSALEKKKNLKKYSSHCRTSCSLLDQHRHSYQPIETSNKETLNYENIQTVNEHINSVFSHISLQRMYIHTVCIAHCTETSCAWQQ